MTSQGRRACLRGKGIFGLRLGRRCSGSLPVSFWRHLNGIYKRKLNIFTMEISEPFKIALTALVGIAIFVAGQVFSKIFIEPIYEHRKTIGAIVDSLIYNAGWISNPGNADPNGERKKAADVLRQLSCKLLAETHAIPFYTLFSYLGFVPTRGRVMDSHKCLISLSNNLFEGKPAYNREEVQKLKILLKIDF